jgi:hypothetical protein
MRDVLALRYRKYQLSDSIKEFLLLHIAFLLITNTMSRQYYVEFILHLSLFQMIQSCLWILPEKNPIGSCRIRLSNIIEIARIIPFEKNGYCEIL